MAETTVIREFLVALGFKNDEPALKKFTESIEHATKLVFGLATTIEATAITVAYGVQKLASNMEKVYFASVRTGASATNLVAFDRAAQNLGASAGEAQGAVESLASQLRRNPAGTEGLLRSLGVQTRDAKGQLRDTVDLLTELGKQLANRPTYLAMQYGTMFGISDNMVLALRNGDFARQLAEMQHVLKDSGLDSASKDAHELENNLRLLGTRFDAIKAQVGEGVFKALKPQLDELNTWIESHQEEIQEGVTNFTKGVVVAGKIILPLLADIGTGWANIYSWVKGLGEKVVDLLPTSLVDLIGGATSKLFEKLGIKDQVDDILKGDGSDSAGKSGPSAAGAPSGTSTNASRPRTRKTPASQWIEDMMHGVVSKAAIAMQYLQQHGRSREEAAGILANLNDESSLNENAVGDHGHAFGIAQWHKAGQDAFKRWAGIDIRDSTFMQQLAFLEHDIEGNKQLEAALRRAASSAGQSASVFSRMYERPFDADGAAARRSEAAVTIAQTNNFNVQGGDPTTVAKAVAAEQGRVNSDLTRNFRVVVQ
jgi:hypothetical protein